ncbi:GRB2-associated-binding protein 4 isoform X3 [Homo sapiens]|uniref:GRB2-associated-binding protein 4 isoform X3 n=1 Tax=Homo sapiens TaxID=9606 RepID=UPI0005D0286B|nr:GRB2-associated-binding protein 4 isoform X3 [Homo sapiens]|eukprot:XP_011544417.1 GRB2-associated-binding protein 4 isoform X4 [Homo sapiens]
MSGSRASVRSVASGRRKAQASWETFPQPVTASALLQLSPAAPISTSPKNKNPHLSPRCLTVCRPPGPSLHLRGVSARTSTPAREQNMQASSGKYTQHGGGNASRPAESMHEGVCSFLPGRTLVGLSDSIASEGSCVPMNPGSPTLPAVKQAGDDSQGVCIPVGSCLVRFDLLGSPLTELSMHQDLSQGHEVQLPPVNRSLKPNQKANPTPPNLRNNRVINELSFKPPVTEPWSGTSHTFDSSSSQHPISTQSITNTDSEDSGERYLFPQNPASAFPVSGGTSSSAPPRSTGNIHYAALDFQPSKPSIGSVTSGKKVDYVQVDLEKTQALQKTMHEQMCLRQSSEPPRGAKL